MGNYLDVFNNYSENVLLSSLIIFVFLTYVAIFIMQITKFKHTLIVSITMGIMIGLYYLGATSASEVNILNDKIVASINSWLSIIWNVFMLLLLVVLPLYVFSMVSTTFTNHRHHSHGRKVLIVSFLSLWAMTLLGIIIAIAFFPIMYLLRDALQLTPSYVGGDSKTVLQTFLGYYSIMIVVSIVLAITFALIMNLLHTHIHEKGESVISFIEKIRNAIRGYLKIVTLLVPYVISSMIVILFNNYGEVFVNTAQTLSVFIMLFFIGLLIITGLEFGAIHLFRRNKDTVTSAELNKRSVIYSIKDFSVQSAPVLYPITVSYVKGLGVSDEITETVPTLSTFMGYSMCGGFYPALVVLFTLLQQEHMDVLTTASIITLISLMVPLIMIMTLGMTGVPGADVAIILGLLSTLGLNPGYFYTIYLVEPLLDKFRGIGNSYGFSAASVIADRICYKGEKNNNQEDNSNIINLDKKEVENGN